MSKSPNNDQPDRRDFLRAALTAMGTSLVSSTAMLNSLVSDETYPWIADPKALAALKELDHLNASGMPDFRTPMAVENYILGIESPKPIPLKNKTLFGDIFWKILGTRSKGSIHSAVLRARQALKTEEELEPHRQELIKQITDMTGEQPWLLRLEPGMRQWFKRIIAKDFPKDLPEEVVYRLSNLQFVPADEGLPYLQNGARLLEEYEQAWLNGTISEFAGHQRARLHNERHPESAAKISRNTLKGKNYVSSQKEKDAPVEALRHFLNIPATTIDSGSPRLNQTMYQSPVYIGHIRTRKPVNEHILDLINEAFPEKSRTSMEIIKDPDISTYTRKFTIINPPAALADIIEEAKQKKKETLSAQR